jgi:CBS domain-containing protein
MSPRAAWRLERLGFQAYDYAAGKVDWLAAGRRTIRAEPGPRRALDAADRDPITCSPDTSAATLPVGSVIVVNEHGIVLGRVRAGDRRTDQPAEAIMEPGPATVRAHEPLDELLARMARRHVEEIIVTTPEGRLLGVVHRTQPA